MNSIIQQINEWEETISVIKQDKNFSNEINKIIGKIVVCFRNGNKVLFCGNGGSAAEAQHLAAELSGKFKLNRKALPAEACHLNLSFLTAVSNDYDFSRTYERYIEAFGKQGDVIIGLTTSGNSENLIKAFKIAQEINLTTIALTGENGGQIRAHADYLVNIPSKNVPRIQEAHLLIGHIICEAVEKEIFGNAG
jgi:D-sedoheptulose 7-phosphate isomerase